MVNGLSGTFTARIHFNCHVQIIYFISSSLRMHFWCCPFYLFLYFKNLILILPTLHISLLLENIYIIWHLERIFSFLEKVWSSRLLLLSSIWVDLVILHRSLIVGLAWASNLAIVWVLLLVLLLFLVIGIGLLLHWCRLDWYRQTNNVERLISFGSSQQR